MNEGVFFLKTSFVQRRLLMACSVGMLAIFSSASAQGASSVDPWRSEMAVEVARADSIALNRSDMRAAIIVRTPSIAENRNSFSLWEVDYSRSSAPPRLVLGADYLADVRWSAATGDWFVRADLGHGVQLYAVRQESYPTLVLSHSCTPVGGYSGTMISSYEEERCVGVLAFGIAPNGRRLWYTTFSPQGNHPVHWVYRPDKSYAHAISNYQVAGPKEIHLFDLDSRRDRVLGTAGGSAVENRFPFSPELTSWRSDAILRTVTGGAYTAAFESQTIEIKVEDGRSTVLPMPRAGSEQWSGLPYGNGYLAVRPIGEKTHLLRVSLHGDVQADFGATTIDSFSDLMVEGAGGEAAFSARDDDGPKLFEIRNGALREASPEGYTAKLCDADLERAIYLCVVENLNEAPRLVAVQTRRIVATIFDFNSGLRNLQRFAVKRTTITNQYGSTSRAYILCPPGFDASKSYPVVVITHASSAANTFVDSDNQWAFPVQSLLQSGYVVVLANESPGMFSSGYVSPLAAGQTAAARTWGGLDGVSTLEALAEMLIGRGIARPGQIGLAGYSRGGSLTALALSRSRYYRAGIVADGYWYNAGGYWQGAGGAALYRSIFGGSPFDSAAQKQYEALSPSVRAAHFSAALLQFYPSSTGYQAIELHNMLKEAGIPVETVFFRDETHILHRPVNQLAAMRCSKDWFDYWLLGRRDSERESRAQYERWDNMAAIWAQRRTLESDAMNRPVRQEALEPNNLEKKKGENQHPQQ